MYILTDHLSV